VVTGKQAEQAGAFNVNRVKELIFSSIVLLKSLNTGINIRGLGSPYGLNDGIDPGVGFMLMACILLSSSHHFRLCRY
jgi:iron complex outermembrane receptor protein